MRAMAPPNRARVRRIRDRLREIYGRPFAPAARPRPGRADPHRPLAVDQRPQPRRRVPAPARALRELGRGARRAQRRGRGGDPARRHLEGQVGADPGDPARARRRRPERPRATRRVEEGRDRLVALPGVGRKTAACVLLFAFGKRDVPVDTHVSRVGTRLGLFREKAPFEELHDTMLELTPRGQELEFHVNLLRHGRRTCHARRPRCAECALLRMCPSGYNLRQAD